MLLHITIVYTLKPNTVCQIVCQRNENSDASASAPDVTLSKCKSIAASLSQPASSSICTCVSSTSLSGLYFLSFRCCLLGRFPVVRIQTSQSHKINSNKVTRLPVLESRLDDGIVRVSVFSYKTARCTHASRGLFIVFLEPTFHPFASILRPGRHDGLGVDATSCSSYPSC